MFFCASMRDEDLSSEISMGNYDEEEYYDELNEEEDEEMDEETDTTVFQIFLDPDIAMYKAAEGEEESDEEESEEEELDARRKKKKERQKRKKEKEKKRKEEQERPETVYAEFHMERYKPETERGGSCVLFKGKWCTIAAFYRSQPAFYVAAVDWKERVLVDGERGASLLWSHLKRLRMKAIAAQEEEDPNSPLSPSRRLVRNKGNKSKGLTELEKAKVKAKQKKDARASASRSPGFSEKDMRISPSANKVGEYESMVDQFLDRVKAWSIMLSIAPVATLFISSRLPPKADPCLYRVLTTLSRAYAPGGREHQGGSCGGGATSSCSVR